MRRFVLTTVLAGILLIPVLAIGQPQIGFIRSDRIRGEYEDFKEADAQFQLELRKAQFEFNAMMAQLDSLRQAYDTQRLMSSPEWRKQKEQEIVQKETAIQNFQAAKIGPEGELYRKQAQMEYELVMNVGAAVEKVAISKGFDFILDGSTTLLYGKPTYDLTDDVLHELRKGKAE